eukprot:scaffold90895_cov50-Attheya_sp.AAC.1
MASAWLRGFHERHVFLDWLGRGEATLCPWWGSRIFQALPADDRCKKWQHPLLLLLGRTEE